LYVCRDRKRIKEEQANKAKVELESKHGQPMNSTAYIITKDLGCVKTTCDGSSVQAMVMQHAKVITKDNVANLVRSYNRIGYSVDDPVQDPEVSRYIILVESYRVRAAG
jgi:hypothetical protein